MSVRLVQVTIPQTTFAEIRAAAHQTNLPISAFLKEVIEADLATRRMTSPLLHTVKATGDVDSPSARTTR
jgi:hypothetical protein